VTLAAGQLTVTDGDTIRIRGDAKEVRVIGFNAPAAYDEWLDPSTPVDAAKGLLVAKLDGELQFHHVGCTVKERREEPGRRPHRADQSAFHAEER
jgi:putative SOS response-associated peptidase YedK